MKKIITLLITLCILNIHLFAQSTNLIEDFFYPNATTGDSLTAATTGSGLWRTHSGSLLPPLYTTTGLTFTGYSGSGIGGAATFSHGAGSRIDQNRAFSAYNSGSVYASFMLNVALSGGSGTTSDYFFHFCDTFGTSGLSNLRGRIFVRDGATTGTFQLGLSKGSAATAAVWTSNSYPIATTCLVVLKYMFNTTTSTDDSVYAWVFDTSIPSTEPAPQLVATDMTISDIVRVRSICIRQGTTGLASGALDGIRVSNAWSSGPLPIVLKSFQALLKDNQTQLVWSSAQELNASYYEIQKSNDARSFESIGKVAAKNSLKGSSYSFLVNQSNTSPSYYRLKMLDRDGKMQYSNIVKTNALRALEITLSPNPFTSTLNVKSNEEIKQLEIFDMSGSLQLSKSDIGNTECSISNESLKPGYYIIKVQGLNEVKVMRVIKQ